MLIDDLKKENMLALKEHDQNKRAVLSVVINKYMLLTVEGRTAGKKVDDSDVIKLIQKTLKELEDEKSAYQEVGNAEEVEKIEKQMHVIDQYLPKQLSEEEIREEISKLTDKSVPSVMKHFKTNFAGQVNMGMVNKILKSL